jgi:protease-4
VSLETDLLLDRRRIKRRLFFWRGAAIAAALLAVLASFRGFDGSFGVEGSHIERLTVSGIITENRKLTEAVNKLAERDSVKALIVVIDSPGGSVAGGESLYAAIGKVAAKKPVVAVMGGTAASAGYMIAVPAQRIFAREATITGSIGVILATGEASGLLKILGLTAEAITSGPLKDQPSFTRPLTEQGRLVLKGLVMDMYDQFVQMVSTGRHMDPARVRELGDGRAYTGRQARSAASRKPGPGWRPRASRPACRSATCRPAAAWLSARSAAIPMGFFPACGKVFFHKGLCLTEPSHSGSLPGNDRERPGYLPPGCGYDEI